jgi:PAS domain S-box-containing protein
MLGEATNSRLTLFKEIRMLGAELIRSDSGSAVASGVPSESGNMHRLLRAIMESFPHSMCIKDVNGRFLVCNSAMLRLMQIKSVRELIGRTESDFKSPSDARYWRQMEQKAVRSGEPCVDWELPVTDSRGNQRWCLVTCAPIKDESGKVIALAQTSLDATEKILARKALDESEQRYRALFDGAAEGILVTDPETRDFVYANPAICKMLGYSEQELICMRVDDIHPKEHLPSVLAEFKAQAIGEKTLAVDIPCLCKDSSIKYALVNNTKVILDSKECMVGFFTDVTKLKQTEHELDKIQKRMHLILKHSFDGINICEIDLEKKKRRLIFCNDRYVEMSGRSREELMAAGNLNDFLQDDATPETQSQWFQNVRDQVPFKGQSSWIRPDGEENYYEWAAAPTKIDGRYYIVGIDRDITEQIKAREKLQKAETEYRALVEQIPAIIYTAALDEASTTLFASPQAQTILGFLPEQYKQDPDIWRKRLHPEDRERVMRELAAAHAAGEAFCSEYRMLTADDEVVWFRDEATIVKDDSGKPLCLQGVMLDISERKRAERELEQIKQELEVRVRQRTEELQRVNRELRSLAAELSFAEEKTRRQIATDVHDHIGQNLAIAKIKLQALAESSLSKKAEQKLKEVRDLITQTIESARSLTFEISPPVLYELGFEPAVEWLLRKSRIQAGLVTQFSTDGKHKELHENVSVFLFQAVRELLVNVAKHAEARHVDVSVKRISNEIRICVADDGKGFDMQNIASRTREEAGFGLFSIGERINHIGGRLTVESKPGYGTKITLAAPLARNQNGAKDVK